MDSKSQKMEMTDCLERFFSGGRLTAEEERELERWMQDEANRREYYRMRSAVGAVYAQRVGRGVDAERAWERFERRYCGERCPERRVERCWVRRMVWAAAVAVLLGAGVFFGLQWEGMERGAGRLAQGSTEEFANRVVLTLSDGRRVALEDTQGEWRERNGASMRHDGSRLTYRTEDSVATVVYNTLRTPRGSEFRVELADGTQVWLNAGSELRYPTGFRGRTREVYLSGEAYFDVAENGECPFVVHASAFDVRVTGTEFNVRDYSEEPAAATLAEGRVEVVRGERATALVPGEEATLTEEGVRVRKVNLEEAIAWRSNAFSFKEKPLKDLLNEIARWYDLEVFYLNPSLKELHFTAWFLRSESIGEVVRILEKTQKVKFSLNGKTLIVKEY